MAYDAFVNNVLKGGLNQDGVNDNIGNQFVPEVWGQHIMASFDKNTIFTKLGVDLSSQVSAYGDKIHLPHTGVPSVKTVSQLTALAPVNTGSEAEAETELNVNQHHVADVWMPDAMKVQSSYDLMGIYGGRAGYSMARAVDNFLAYKIVANLTSVLGSVSGVAGNTTSNVNLGSGEIDATALSKLMGIVTKETGSTDDWAIVLGSTAYGSLAKLGSGNAFVQGTQGSPAGSSFASTGIVGSLLGMPVILSNNAYLDMVRVEADAGKNITVWNGFDTDNSTNDDTLRGFAIHKSALYQAFSKKPKMEMSYQHQYMQSLLTVDSIYGAVVRNADAAGERRIIALTTDA